MTTSDDDDDVFKVFSAPRLAPSTQRLQPRIRSVHSTFTKMSYKFPHPSEPFITSFPPPLPYTQGRLDNSAEIAFLCSIRKNPKPEFQVIISQLLLISLTGR